MTVHLAPFAPAQAPWPPVRDRQRRRRRVVGLWLVGLGLAPLAGAGLAASAGVAAWPLVLGAVAGWLGLMHGRMLRPGGVPVLTYHSVSAAPDWLPWAAEISVTPETFDRHLATLRRMGCVFLDTVAFCRLREAGGRVPAGAVMLHLDDGYLDTWVAAAPILRRHGARATLFVSLDFIEPDRPLRPTIDADGLLQWDGYLSWREIRALEAGGVISVEPHGVDHGRVPTGPRKVATVTPANWRRLAWLQWAATPGPKHDWHRRRGPWAAPFGTPVPESGTALAARAWGGGEVESTAAHAERVRRDLRACVATFLRELGKRPAIFCWPQNQASAVGRQIAAEEGYLATTAGRGENRRGEDPRVLSRVHVGDRALGFRWLWMEGVALRATVRCFQGNLYWYPVLAAIHATRAVVGAVRRRLGRWS